MNLMLIKKLSQGFSRHKTSLENYKYLIILLVIIVSLTSVYSIYASYGMLRTFFRLHIPNEDAATFIGFVSTLLLELLTVGFITKAIYLIKSKIFPDFWYIVLFAVLIYVGNFYLSTNGLEKRAIEKTDKQPQIIAKFEADSLKIENRYIGLIDSLTTANAKLGSKNTLFNYTQLQANYMLVNRYNLQLKNKLHAISIRKNAYLQANKALTNKTGASNYYLFGVIQLAQILIYIILSNFYWKIHWENLTKEKLKSEEIAPHRKQVEQEIQKYAIEYIKKSLRETTVHFLANQDSTDNAIGNKRKEKQDDTNYDNNDDVVFEIEDTRIGRNGNGKK